MSRRSTRADTAMFRGSRRPFCSAPTFVSRPERTRAWAGGVPPRLRRLKHMGNRHATAYSERPDARGGGRISPPARRRRLDRRARDGRRAGREGQTQSAVAGQLAGEGRTWRSEEHTSELQSLMRISYAVFCLKKKSNTTPDTK